MRKVTTLASFGVVLAILVALVQAAPARAAVQVNTSIDLTDFEVFVPCANDGAGEVISLNGPLHILLTFTVNNNNVSGKEQYQPQGLSGVGLVTGDKYQGTGLTQQIFKGSLNNGQFTSTFVNNFRMIGQSSGNNFLVHETFHVTFNANGDATAFQDNFSVDCK